MTLRHMAVIEVPDENTIAYQREYWSTMLAAEISLHGYESLGFAWGDPESERAVDAQGRELGNYASVLSRLRWKLPAAVARYRTAYYYRALELGSYGGKWTQYILPYVDHLWCVDLSETSWEALKARFGNSEHGYPRVYERVSFYVTPGYDLAAVQDLSVDLVFSMDSLVRAPLDAIASYLAEFYRVLRVGGHVLVHLPWDDSPGSRERNFTRLNRPWLLAHIGQFSQADLDETTLKHGLLLHLVK